MKEVSRIRRFRNNLSDCLLLNGQKIPYITNPGGGGGVLPYKGLIGMCDQPGYVFRDFCLKQGIFS